MAEGLKLKLRKFWGLIPTLAEVAEENLVGGLFCPPIMNRVKIDLEQMNIIIYH